MGRKRKKLPFQGKLHQVGRIKRISGKEKCGACLVVCKVSSQAQKNEDRVLALSCSSKGVSIPCTGQRKIG